MRFPAVPAIFVAFIPTDSVDFISKVAEFVAVPTFSIVNFLVLPVSLFPIIAADVLAFVWSSIRPSFFATLSPVNVTAGDSVDPVKVASIPTEDSSLT